MIPCGKQIRHYSSGDKRGSKPQRDAVRLCRRSALADLELLEKEGFAQEVTVTQKEWSLHKKFP
jgi:hypothetical protein